MATSTAGLAATRSGTYRYIRMPVGLVPKPVTSVSDAAAAGEDGSRVTAMPAMSAASAARSARQGFLMGVVLSGCGRGERAATAPVDSERGSGRDRNGIGKDQRAEQDGVPDGPVPVPWKPNCV